MCPQLWVNTVCEDRIGCGDGRQEAQRGLGHGCGGGPCLRPLAIGPGTVLALSELRAFCFLLGPVLGTRTKYSCLGSQK